MTESITLDEVKAAYRKHRAASAEATAATMEVPPVHSRIIETSRTANDLFVRYNELRRLLTEDDEATLRRDLYGV